MESVCVFCGSSDAVHSDYKTAAFQLGRLLAESGIRLIYGGSKNGLMGQVADGALSAGGEVTGIIVTSMNTPAVIHGGLTHLEVLPNMHGRKARMHELSEAFIALPGGFGTWDELFESITWSQIGVHEKPVGLLNVNQYYNFLLAAMDHAVGEGFALAEHRQSVFCESDAQELLNKMSSYEHPREAVKKWMKGG